MIDENIKTKAFQARARSQALSQVSIQAPTTVGSGELEAMADMLARMIYRFAMEQQEAEQALQSAINAEMETAKAEPKLVVPDQKLRVVRDD